MKLPRRQFLRLAASAAALPAVSRIARAETYPARPVTIIVPFPPGGPTDTIGRLLAERMQSVLGQPVVVENVTGANGSIGVGRAVHAANDGYTLSIGQVGTHVFNGAVYRLQYDLLNDFEPISLLTDGAYLIVGKKTLLANDLHGLITWLKANPEKASAATAGVGSLSHVSGALFQHMTGTQFQFVPYRGAAPAALSVVAGETDFEIGDAVTCLPQARVGAVKAFAVTAQARLQAAPDIPTVDEAGAQGLYVSLWHGLWAPKGTPKEIMLRLNAAVVDALADSKMGSRLADLGQQIFSRDRQTSEALGAFQRAEAEKWWPIIKAAGIKAE